MYLLLNYTSIRAYRQFNLLHKEKVNIIQTLCRSSIPIGQWSEPLTSPEMNPPLSFGKRFLLINA